MLRRAKVYQKNAHPARKPMIRGALKKRKRIREHIRNSDVFFRMRFRSETAVSRVLSRTAIYLASALPQNSVPPADCAGPARGKSPSAYGVASDRVYTCTQLPDVPVSSYLAFSSLPRKTAVFFCCTFPEVTLGGRYPLSCPVKPGLSSRQYLSATWRAAVFPSPTDIIPEKNGKVNKNTNLPCRAVEFSFVLFALGISFCLAEKYL